MPQPLPRPSVSPLPSYASRPGVTISRSPSFAETIMAIWSWLRGGHRPMPLRRQIAEARLVAEVAAELEAEIASFWHKSRSAAHHVYLGPNAPRTPFRLSPSLAPTSNS
jgi:hypothetical protein